MPFTAPKILAAGHTSEEILYLHWDGDWYKWEEEPARWVILDPLGQLAVKAKYPHAKVRQSVFTDGTVDYLENRLNIARQHEPVLTTKRT